MNNLSNALNAIEGITFDGFDKRSFIAYARSIDKQFAKIDHLLATTDEPKTRVSSIFVFNSSDHCSSQEESCSALLGKQHAMHSDRVQRRATNDR